MEPVSHPWRAIEPAPGPVIAPPSGSSRWLAAAVLGSVALLAALLVGGWILVSSAPRPTVTIEGGSLRPIDLAGADAPATSTASGALSSPAAEARIVVDVEGAVMEPGLYRLASGSRVGDAIAAAGGYSTQVDAAATSQSINLAEKLADGAKIRIPARGEATPPAAGAGPGTPPLFGGASGSGSATSLAGPVDLNRATQAELESLPGIGPVTAQKIIDARSQAPFLSVEELRSRGILGPKTYQKIAPLVIVGG
jgi:competence protein ComEA